MRRVDAAAFLCGFLIVAGPSGKLPPAANSCPWNGREKVPASGSFPVAAFSLEAGRHPYLPAPPPPDGARGAAVLFAFRGGPSGRCSTCGFADPTLARPVGSESWLSMEREAHRRWNLLWKDGKWCKAPRVEVEAVRTICTYENRAGNPLRYSGCAPSHRHGADAKPRHAASTAYGIGQFLRQTRDSMDKRYPGQFNWECALCQYRGIFVYIGPHRPKYKSPSALVSRGGAWRGY